MQNPEEEPFRANLEQHTLHILVKDAVVQFVSRSIGMTLKLEPTNRTAIGVSGRELKHASFKVHITDQPGIICLENIAFTGQFICAAEDSFKAHEDADNPRNKLIVVETDDGFLQLESFVYRGCYITANTVTKGILPMAGSKSSSSIDSHFILRPKYLPGMIQTLPSPAKNHDSRTVTPHIMVAFINGNCISIKSKTSDHYLSVSSSGNVVTGVGKETEENSKFYVRTTVEGSILLQSAVDARKYLCISDDTLSCTGSGGRTSNFHLFDHQDGGLLSLESASYPHSHIGISENGMSTVPSKTKNTDPEGQFYFTVMQLANSRALLKRNPRKSKLNTRSLYAGPSIMSKFRGNSLIQLVSLTTSQPLWAIDRIVAATVQGFLGVNTIKLGSIPVVAKNDTQRLFDQFYVHVRRPGIVALQNAKSQNFLCIKKGVVSADGTGDAYCNFAVTEDDKGFVTMESELYLDQFLGFTSNGSASVVDCNNATSKFLVRVMNITGTPYPIPSVAANVDSSQVAPIVQVAFQDLVKIHLRPRSFVTADANLRVMDDASINCAGKDGDPYATFIVHCHSELRGIISLQNAMNTFNWLAIREGRFIGDGDENDEALFKVIDKGGGLVSFESVAKSLKCHQCYIAVKSNGTPGNTKASIFHDETLFQVHIAQLPKFYDGAKVILFSKEFRKALRLMPNGDVNCFGGHGMKAQFFVHGRRRSGVVALQNAMFPDKWLCMHDGKVTVGSGDHESEFRFHEKDGHVAFESVTCPGHYVGVLDNGQLKEPVKVSSPDNYDLFDVKNAFR